MSDEQATPEAGQTPTPEQAQPDATGEKAERVYTKAEVEALVRDRLANAQKVAEKAAQKAREDAQAEAAAKNGEWQTLAEQRATKLAEVEAQLSELDAAKAQADRYAQALGQQVTALRKDVPKHLHPLLDKLDVAEQLEWLAANREQIAPPKASGVPATPRAQGGMDAAQLEAARQSAAAFYRDL